MESAQTVLAQRPLTLALSPKTGRGDGPSSSPRLRGEGWGEGSGGIVHSHAHRWSHTVSLKASGRSVVAVLRRARTTPSRRTPAFGRGHGAQAQPLRRARPGVAPVGWPFSRTTVPLTST